MRRNHRCRDWLRPGRSLQPIAWSTPIQPLRKPNDVGGPVDSRQPHPRTQWTLDRAAVVATMTIEVIDGPGGFSHAPLVRPGVSKRRDAKAQAATPNAIADTLGQLRREVQSDPATEPAKSVWMLRLAWQDLL